MLSFALKDMRIKRVKIILIVVSIIISAGVALLAYNVSGQVQDGIIGTAAYYDMLLGPSGSATQLAMNTLFFTDAPLGTIPYSYVEELRESGLCNSVVPFSMGDSYNSARIIGTTPAFLSQTPLSRGDMFAEEDVYTCVVGYSVAKTYSLSVGDKLVSSHGITGSGTEHAASPLTVVGILDKTKTAYDNAVFTSYKTVWAVHGLEEEHEDEHEEHEEGEAHAEEGTVCAILVKSKSFNDYYKLSSHYGENASLLVINPSTVLREVLENVDISSEIVYILCIIILIMNIFVISVITLLNMYDSKKEIALMRLIGISMRKINALFLIENGIIGVISTLAALLVSRAAMAMMSDYVASMGIVLDTAKFYPLELCIMAAVFIISVLPSLICTRVMASKDSI